MRFHSHCRLCWLAAFVLIFALTSAAWAATRANTSPVRLSVIDSVVQEAIREGQIPGAVVLIGHNDAVVYRKAFGSRSLEPRHEAMTLDTIFDVASLTKVVATTTAIMQLFEQGKIRFNDAVAKYIPEFAQNGKDDITVRQLLTHFSGLEEDLDLKPTWQGKETAYRMAFQETPQNPPGSGFLYSDINFITLGALVERVSGMPLDQYAKSHIFGPLKMAHTRFVPPAAWRPKIAPTQYDDSGTMLRGVAHDPTARRMGGVAGHAGVFSTADDLAKFAQALLSGGTILSPLAIEKMTTPEQPPNATVARGFGWDLDSPFSTNRGELLPVGSYGHTGFTGTSLWIDPTTRTYIILLTNAVHPRGGNAIALRTKVATAVASAMPLTMTEKDKLRWASITGYNEAQAAAKHISTRNGAVKAGIDVLEEHNFDILIGADAKGEKKHIGVLTNETGADSQGRRTIDVLARAPGVSLDAIFSPEHGVTGELDTTNVGNSKDEATGVTVYSVYGAKDADRRPSIDLLKNLDAIVVDMQDAGVRFYTYTATLGYFLEAAAKAGTRIVVLDRPNPVTGAIVQGPVSDAGKESFVNYHPVPVRYGLTIGELAKLYNVERGINAKLDVVPLEGWQRGDWYDSTGLAWVNPSPNLRSLTEAALYPGVGLVEGTNVSVGRGTDTPFELLGAPWIKGRELAKYLNERSISGVRFVPVTFTPTTSNYSGQKCEGVNIVLVARSVLDAPEMGIELASALRKLYPQNFKMERIVELLINREAYEALQEGRDPRRIAQDWQEQVDKFQQVRQKYLLYK